MLWLLCGLLLVCLPGAVPWRHAAMAFRITQDSRNTALTWIGNNVPRGSSILLAKELGIDYRSIDGAWKVILFSAMNGLPALATVAKACPSCYLVLPVFDCDRRRADSADASRTAVLLNAQYHGLPRLAHFGETHVLVNYFIPPLALQNPELVIARFTEP